MQITINEALQKGIEAHKTGDFQKAAQFYTSILKVDVKHAHANHNMAVLSVGIGLVEKALPFFKTALETDPSNVQFWLSYIDSLINLDQLGEAETMIDQAKSNGATGTGFTHLEQRFLERKLGRVTSSGQISVGRQGQNNALGNMKLEQALRFAKRMANEGSPEKAKNIYRDILVKFPKNKKALVGLQALSDADVGNISPIQEVPANTQKLLMNLYHSAHHEKLLEQANTLLQDFPSSIFLLNICGVTYGKLGKFDAALSAYKKLITIKPSHAQAHYNMGNTLREKGELEQAIMSYSKAISIKPDYAAAHNNMGFVFRELGRLEEAMTASNTAVRNNPKFSEAYFNIGTILNEQEKPNEAIEAFKLALENKPDYSAAYNNIGISYTKLGKLNAAIESYNAAVALDPNYLQAFNNLGIALKEQGKLNEAVTVLQKAIAIKPGYDDALNNLGVCYQEQGDFDKAIDAYADVIANNPSHHDAYYNMGCVLKARGKLEEALVSFKKDGSQKSQIYILKCLYDLKDLDGSAEQLDYLINEGENNAVIGSYISRLQSMHGKHMENPFCNDPLRYVIHTNLSTVCDFNSIFVKGATEILNDKTVQNRSQSLLTNGVQTSGNLFNQIGDLTDNIQSIIRAEIEKYRALFKDSPEGLFQSWPTNYNLYGWLVSMKSGGELAAHIHDQGWISGSIYINVPLRFKEHSGNLVVTTDENVHAEGIPKNSKSIDVVTGSLCLFPASLLHYTVPFEAEDNRIVLAFDVVPTGSP